MSDFRDLVVRMRLAIGDTVDDPVAKARIEVLTHLLSEHAATHGDASELRRQLAGLAQAMEELGPKALLGDLFRRVDEITATRH